MIDNFLEQSLVERMIKEFPVPDTAAMRSEHGGVSRKHSVSDVRGIGGVYVDIDNIVASESFKSMLEYTTGIDSLIYDPTYFGGGTHNNLSGQGMDPHVDFNILNIDKIGKVHRRINAILYLNEHWKEEYGGCLDLHSNPWEPATDQIVRVVPEKNRLVLFETNEVSWHGFHTVNESMPLGMTRKSFAIYMYSNKRPKEEIRPNHGTFYVPRIPIELLTVGSPVTQELLDVLFGSRTHALNMIRNAYDHEMKLNDYVNDRFYEISVLKEENDRLGALVKN